jgi:P22 coat protein - gene protein 5
VDKRQAAGDMQGYLEDRAAYKLADTADSFIAGLYTGCAQANILLNSGTSSLTPGSELTPAVYGGSSSAPADFYLKVVLPLKVKLDEAYVPKQGRYLVVPPWAEALLEQTQAFVSVATPAQQEVFAEGLIGRVAGFDVYVSNNSINFDQTLNSNQGGWVIQAGHPMAITFAEQIVQTEALRLQTTFGDAVRGLHVYGGKLVRPDHIAVAGVQRPLTI